MALRSEVGFDAGVYGTNSDINGFFLTPALTAEPRWYYNLNKRSTKQKRTDSNTGNFISLKTTFHPDWFILSEAPNINVISDISIIPTWGIRRSISTHFNYELGFGLGYVFFLEDTNAFLNSNSSELTANLHIRLGYKF